MFVLPGAEITENKVNLSSICVDDSSLNLKSNLALTLGYRANGRNIVGQKPPTLLDVTCCVRLHTKLYVAGSCRVKFVMRIRIIFSLSVMQFQTFLELSYNL